MAVILPRHFQFKIGTSYSYDSGVIIDSADDYTQHARALSQVPYFTFELSFLPMYREDHYSLTNWLEENRLEEISIEVDGRRYNVRVTGDLRVNWNHGMSMVECSMQARGYRVDA